MPLDQVITNLPDLKVLEAEPGPVVILKAVSTAKVKCIYCGSDHLRTKDSFVRILKHVTFGDRTSELHLKSHKYRCEECGKYFNQRFRGILPRKRSTEQFRREVAKRHHDGVTQKTLSQRVRVSCSTIEKWYQELIYLENQKFTKKCPRVLGIDEHFFTKKKVVNYYKYFIILISI